MKLPYIIYPMIFQISHNIPLLHPFSHCLQVCSFPSEENALHLHMQLHHSVDVLKEAQPATWRPSQTKTREDAMKPGKTIRKWV